MADITLAEFNGRVWLVGGEVHIDDLLANTLPPDVSIEMVRCESQSEVHSLWVQNCGEPASAADAVDHPSQYRRPDPPQFARLCRVFRPVVGDAGPGRPGGDQRRRPIGGRSSPKRR